ncbi:MAG: LPS biosynthesis glycosyltransferase [Merismopedia sp. SIO2A8]|nr:LPS biosynthesis glycosyltransferase [Symploca sp. SIO2B6]NET48766.1 LPS biosynthesis glycosyltransferase [Merismopedia sp. SIO2A8]
MPPSLDMTLSCNVQQTFIIAHNENTHPLETTLTQEGFAYEVLRQPESTSQLGYSRSYLALLNHCEAWKRASEINGLTLIVEADFVPVRNMGSLPMPVQPTYPSLGVAWLYTCACQLYSVSKEGYAQGFSTSMVAYLVAPMGAIALLNMAEELKQSPGPYAYSAWDSDICKILRWQGFENFIPLRNYGEHGGQPNPEHHQHGLSRTHRADVLYGPLAFTPMYALPEGNLTEPATSEPITEHWLSRPFGKSPFSTIHQLWRYSKVRLYARTKGIARLMAGKFLRQKVFHESSVPFTLLRFAIRRQLSWSL